MSSWKMGLGKVDLVNENIKFNNTQLKLLTKGKKFFFQAKRTFLKTKKIVP